MKKYLLIVVGLLLIAGIAYATTYQWKCMYCQQIITTERNAPPDSGSCDRAPGGKHKWFRQWWRSGRFTTSSRLLGLPFQMPDDVVKRPVDGHLVAPAGCMPKKNGETSVGSDFLILLFFFPRRRRKFYEKSYVVLPMLDDRYRFGFWIAVVPSKCRRLHASICTRGVPRLQWLRQG